jgi:putative flippase GtrA
MKRNKRAAGKSFKRNRVKPAKKQRLSQNSAQFTSTGGLIRAGIAASKPKTPGFWLKFVKFGGLSGLGWLTDFALLLTLVTQLNIAPHRANFISASFAATAVFIISRETIFSKADGRGLLRILIYIGYTLAVITTASFVLRLLVEILLQLAGQYNWRISAAEASAAAKICVTPPTMLCNFFVSRLLSEKKLVKQNWTN